MTTRTAAQGAVDLDSDEELLHDVQPHLLGTLTAVDWVLVAFTLGLYMVVPYLRQRNTHYVITDERVVIVTGSVSSRWTEDLYLRNVVGVRKKTDFVERLLDLEDVQFRISDRERFHGNRVTTLEALADADAVAETLREHAGEREAA